MKDNEKVIHVKLIMYLLHLPRHYNTSAVLRDIIDRTEMLPKNQHKIWKKN